MRRYIFHLFPNAHLDPVWLWDWMEGLNEGISTVRSVLDLMDEFPDLTFVRGESSIYRHIEETDPKTFDRIGCMIGEGRWDVVGGTFNQPDTNLASTETLCRQYENGLSYFQSRFGIVPKVAWLADSFGHTPGLPNVLTAFGMESFMFTRPNRRDFPMPEPAFWWHNDQDSRILAYRQYHGCYCSDRAELPAILDLTLKEAASHPFRNVGVLMGMGNHGGGPSRRQIQDALKWAKRHPEIEVKFSTFHRFFRDLEKEIAARQHSVPSLRGDMGFCLRGCYSSLAKFKFAYRRAEALLADAEITQNFVRHASPFDAEPLDQAWDGILFNSFHDILPGSSIERAFDEQLAWVGKSHFEAQRARFQALNRLAAEIDTRVPAAPGPDKPTDVPILVWNSLPRPRKAWIELETCLDYRPDFSKSAEVGSIPLHLMGPGREKPAFQEIPTEHNSVRQAAWRKRVVFQSELPALGWKVFRLGREENPQTAGRRPDPHACRASSGKLPSIRNHLWKIAATSDGKIKAFYQGKPFFGPQGFLDVSVFEDIWGSWGGMVEEKDSYILEKKQESWKISETAVLQKGPEQAVLWTRWQGRNSWLDLTFQLQRGGTAVYISGRTLWNERSARLKLVLPSSGALDMQVPASRVRRAQPGHLPFGRWFRRGSKRSGIALVSDVFSDLDLLPGCTQVTIARASRYADDVPTFAAKERWRPATDCGELKFQFCLAAHGADLERIAEELLHPPVTLAVPAHPGKRPPGGSLAELKPECLTLLSAQASSRGKLRLRIQNRSQQSAKAVLRLGKRTLRLGVLKSYEIAVFSVPSGG